MSPIIPGETQSVGKLVALEGNINTITTQLRLLPHSHMILIIPPLDHYLSEDHKREPFEARKFVRDVHIALTQRNEVARSFLQSSSQSRLVFLNGGSVSARAICVAKISQQLTYGNFAEADTIFHDIVKDGVAGLFKDTKSPKTTPFPEPPKATVRPGTKSPKTLDLTSTKSATTLSANQSEQEGNIEENRIPGAQSLRSSRNDSGLQIIHFPGEFRTITPEPVAWESKQGDDIVVTDVSMSSELRHISQINKIDDRQRPISQYSGTFGPQPPSSWRPSFRVPRSRYSTQKNTDIDGDEYYFEHLSQDDENLFSAPQVVYGEACVVDMQSALPTPMATVRWTKSVGDLLMDENSKDSNSFKHAASTNDLRGSFNMSSNRPTRYSSFEQLPKAAFIKASKTTIRRSSTSTTPISGNSIPSRSIPRILMGCGTEVEENSNYTEPVFDIAEDVIIHFTDNSPREIVRSVSEYRSGNFPISPLDVPRLLPTPSSTASMTEEYLPSGQCANHERAESRWTNQNDPLYLDGSIVQEEMKHGKASENVDATKEFLPAPASATFPAVKGPNEKFCEFSGAYTNKSIDIQNEFRSFLNFCFPEEATILNQYQNSLMIESGAFWKDMFSNSSSTICEGPTVDQIIAVGCEKGISDFFRTQLLRQIENIGNKSNGESRSGRLDLRYSDYPFCLFSLLTTIRFLIASAMQTFMSQPLLARKNLDPMTDPILLANLIVPHLETYLATNSLVQFLVLSFPFDQIATVIALRSLLGSDLVKVAGVLDTLSSDPPSFSKYPLSQFHSSHHSHDVVTISLRHAEHSQRYPPKSSFDAETILSQSSSSFSPFFKADYHLPSTASPPEIQNFLTLIRKNIVERLSWYNIEQALLQPFPIPSQNVLMKDASTFTDEKLCADSNTYMSPFPAEHDSFRYPSSLHDSEASDIEILRSPPRLSSFPDTSRTNARSISPPPATDRSSSYSMRSSTIRHIPIAIERESIPDDLTPSSDELFPQGQEQQHQQQQDSEYTYQHSISSSTPLYLNRVHSNISSGSLDLDLEVEEDSEDDAYDRMVMGRYSPLKARRKSMFPNTKYGAGREEMETRAPGGNSRKALRWLGLA
ncbi:hypothetical protein NHQ30_003923 [Ciborinia camelliae]|nr:hypothetical protein NHQ30_003923 [Ciborinia camelliae]